MGLRAPFRHLPFPQLPFIPYIHALLLKIYDEEIPAID